MKLSARRVFHALLLVAVVAALFAATSAPSFLAAGTRLKKLPIYSVKRDDKCLAISFDAAWGNEDTQNLIDILGSYGVRTTFFVVGNWAEKYPESVKALAAAGHEVMTHSDDHAHFASLSRDQIIANLNRGCDKIEASTGVRPTLFRCPYGEYNDQVIQTAEDMGIRVIQWSVDSLDWKDLSAAEITRRVVDKAGPGDIVLFHNAAKHTPEALPGIIEQLQQNGYRIVPISELLLQGDYAIDHTGQMYRPE